jgi:hypothetical protein
MGFYSVTCFCKGKWDGNAPIRIKAESPHEAAEMVCGGPLRSLGRPERLSAEVVPDDVPAQRIDFYARE